MTSVVFRVQDKEGRGPWRPGFSAKWVKFRPDHNNLLPWLVEFPHIDINTIESGHFGCGCFTLDQLRRWFTKSEYKTLTTYGYQAVMMQVDGILASSEKQVLFTRQVPLTKDYTVIRLY